MLMDCLGMRHRRNIFQKAAENPAQTNDRYCYFDPVDEDCRYEPAFAELILKYMREGEMFANAEPILPL